MFFQPRKVLSLALIFSTVLCLLPTQSASALTLSPVLTTPTLTVPSMTLKPVLVKPATAENPAAPTNLKIIQPDATQNTLRLTWTDSPMNDGLKVTWQLVRSADGEWPHIFYSDTNTCDDSASVNAGVTYTYTVQAQTTSGLSPALKGTYTIFGPPKNFSAGLWPGSSSASLSWSETNTQIDHFEVVYKTKDFLDSSAQTVTFPASSRNGNIPISNGESYEFKIRSFLFDGATSPYSNIVVLKPAGGEVAPAMPTDVKIVPATDRVNITLHETSMNVSQFLIERSDGTTAPPMTAGVAPAALSATGIVNLTDQNSLKPGTKYTYRIQAQNGFGNSSFTDPITITTLTSNPVPVPLPATLPTAPASSAKRIAFHLGSSQMLVDDVSQAIDPGKETQPVVASSGRTLIPIRSMVESLGGTVQWVAADNKVVIQLNGKTVELTIGKTAALVNGKTAASDEAPQIINGRTMLPVRFVSENLGLNVKWDAETKTITVQP